MRHYTSTSYTVSFVSSSRGPFGQNGGGPNPVNVLADGNLILSFTPITDATFTPFVTAAFVSDGSTTLEFVGLGPVIPGQDVTTFIDVVQAVAVPEPATMGLMGMGAVALAGFGLRRRRA